MAVPPAGEAGWGMSMIRIGRTFAAMMTVALLLATPAAAAANSNPASALVDPPRDAHYPATNQQLLIPSHGLGMNALLFKASGQGPH